MNHGTHIGSLVIHRQMKHQFTEGSPPSAIFLPSPLTTTMSRPMSILLMAVGVMTGGHCGYSYISSHRDWQPTPLDTSYESNE